MKNYFKYLLPVVLVVVLIMPITAKAATTAEIQAQINALMAQIKALQAQLAQLQSQPATWCHDFNVNLKIGDTGSEVSALHTALSKDGFGAYLEADKVNSEFGEGTVSAVTGFQQKYADEILTPWGLKYGTGFVGKTTRAKLNKLYRCEVGPQICLQDITLAVNVLTGECKELPTSCDVPIGWQKVDKCPAFSCDTKCKNLGYVSGRCSTWAIVPNITQCEVNGVVVDSTGTDCIVGTGIVGVGKSCCCQKPTGNQPPVISGVSGPTALKVNETGTWTVKASDPEQGILSYSVIWGDEGAFIGSKSVFVPTTYIQTATFTHSYSKAGIYTPTFTVADDKGLLAKTSISVNVRETTITPSITVLSPNGGEKWQKDSTQLIKWSAPSTISSVDIYLTFEFDPRLMMVIAIPTPRLLVSNTPNDGLFEWKVDMIGGALTNGYQIKIVDSAHATISDTSDAPFSIVAAGTLAPSGQYSVSILENIKATLDQIQKTINSWR